MSLGAGIKDFEEMVKDNKLDQVHDVFIERLFTILLAGVALIAAFAWDDFMKELLGKLLPETGTLWLRLIYAMALTILAAWVSTHAPSIKRFLQVGKHKKQETAAQK